MKDKLEAIKERYEHLEQQLADPEVVSDMKRYTKLSKEYKDLEDFVTVYAQLLKLEGNLATAKEFIQSTDPEMSEMAQMELEELQPQHEELLQRIKQMLIPKDPEDSKDIIIEIRSGTGGDEASLFAGDLLRMYLRYFEEQGWKYETINETEGTVGGYSKIVIEVNGEDVYGKLKFESGTHRVQRVPKTESQGRVHTSAATVAVIPKLEMEDVDINKADLKVDTFRASGAGGQHVNKTESAVRITHVPTGIVSECQDGRSQLRNREIAMQRLYAKIMEVRKEEHEAELAGRRKSIVGTGDRSGKIRTYNWPQNRVTDHRLEGSEKNFNLDQVVEGHIGPIIETLLIKENTAKMQEGEEAY